MSSSTNVVTRIASFFSHPQSSNIDLQGGPIQNLLPLLTIVLLTVFVTRWFERRRRKQLLYATPDDLKLRKCPLLKSPKSNPLEHLSHRQFPRNHHDATVNNQKLKDLLHKSNELFLKNYSQAKEEKVRKMRFLPLIVVADKMRLYTTKDAFERGTPDEEASFMSDWYDIMKAVDHVPLSLYSLLSVEFPLRSDWQLFAEQEIEINATMREGLKECAEVQRDLLEELDSDTSREALPAQHLERQKRIVSQTLDFVVQILDEGKTTAHAFSSLAAQLRDDLEENITSAAVVQINVMRDVIDEWNIAHPGFLEKAHVIIQSNHFASRGNICLLFFERLLRTSELESQRIMSTEADSSTYLQLLGTSAADTQLSHVFFATGKRMHKDLLSPAAEKYLRVPTTECASMSER